MILLILKIIVMLKKISKFGTVLNKSELKSINGGNTCSWTNSKGTMYSLSDCSRWDRFELWIRGVDYEVTA